ncbi:MAG TPA: translation initiation factor IF-5A [Nautiliaceae bacterium]|nr:translation initiation factor IF-5A [Nautiliaceae bacterium]
MACENVDLKKVNEVKEGTYILIDGVICKITKIEKSKAGKHGSAKARIEAIELESGRKKQIIKSTSDNIEVPIIEKKSAIVSAILDKEKGTVQLMDNLTYEIFEAQVEENLKDQIIEGQEVIYWDMCGKKVIKQIK